MALSTFHIESSLVFHIYSLVLRAVEEKKYLRDLVNEFPNYIVAKM